MKVEMNIGGEGEDKVMRVEMIAMIWVRIKC